jgi:hypothetical protein
MCACVCVVACMCACVPQTYVYPCMCVCVSVCVCGLCMCVMDIRFVSEYMSTLTIVRDQDTRAHRALATSCLAHRFKTLVHIMPWQLLRT